jgi:multiple sugar transport system permease protein
MVMTSSASGALAEPRAVAQLKPRAGRRRVKYRRRVRAVAILVIGLVLALPLFYLLSASLMTPARLSNYPPALVPDTLQFGNYSEAFNYLTPRTILNSILFTALVVLLQWVLTIAAGFAVAKLRFRGRNVISGVFALCLFIPFITILVPTFVIANKLGMTNSYIGLILPVVAQIHFGTLLFRQYISGLPDELIDAARVDGAGWWRVFVAIVIPLAGPATGAYVAISTLTAWNLYLWPLVVATDPAHQVLPLALAPLAGGEYSTITEPVAMAATMIATLPMIAAFLIAQRAFVRGLVGTGIE